MDTYYSDPTHFCNYQTPHAVSDEDDGTTAVNVILGTSQHYLTIDVSLNVLHLSLVLEVL